MTGDGDAGAAAGRRFQGYLRVLEARSGDVTVARLRELARDPVRPVRYAVAQHPATPPDALALLVADADGSVSSAAVHHRSTPTAALEVHARRAPDDVEVIAHHPNAPPRLRARCTCPWWCSGAVAFDATWARRWSWGARRLLRAAGAATSR